MISELWYIQLSGTIPSNNTLLSGTFPIIKNDTLRELELFGLFKNKFTNKISNLFEFPIPPNLIGIALHDNKFRDNHIQNFLDYSLNNLTQLQYLTLHGNKDISGTFPSIVNNSILNIFTIHGCDLFGSLSSQISFSNLTYVSFMYNRLSCDVPGKTFILNIQSKFTLVKIIYLKYPHVYIISIK